MAAALIMAQPPDLRVHPCCALTATPATVVLSIDARGSADMVARLSASDASFYQLENTSTPMYVGTLSILRAACRAEL